MVRAKGGARLQGRSRQSTREAGSRTGSGHGSGPAFLVKATALLFTSEFVRSSLLVSLLPALITQRYGLSLDVVAFAISAHYLLDTVGRSPSGWIVDRLGPRLVTGVGMGIGVLAILFLIFSNASTPFWIVLAVYGMGTSPLWPSVITVATSGRTEGRGTVVGGIFAFWIVAIGIGPMVMNFVLPDGFRFAFAILVAAQVIALGISLSFPERPEKVVKSHVARSVFFSRVRIVKALFPGMFAQTLVLGVLLPEINAFLYQYLHVQGLRYVELLFLGGGVAVVLLVPLGRLGDRLGVRLPLVVGLWGAAVALAGLGNVRSFWWAAMWGGLAGGSYAMVLPAWNSLLASVIDQETEGALWGIFMTVEGFGLVCGPLLGVRAWDILRPAGPFLLAAVILLIMSLFYLTYPLHTLRRTH